MQRTQPNDSKKSIATALAASAGLLTIDGTHATT